MKSTFKVQCQYCYKVTAPRMAKGGDGSLYYPRRHRNGNKPCPGNIIEAEILDIRDYE